MRHVVVYREPGRFAGWPANGGMWAWGNELLVGFRQGYMDLAGGFHAIDRAPVHLGTGSQPGWGRPGTEGLGLEPLAGFRRMQLICLSLISRIPTLLNSVANG